ncbi:MAG TPA: Calx-beta domain-containing protein [Pyrinomonadaceae bacterium]
MLQRSIATQRAWQHSHRTFFALNFHFGKLRRHLAAVGLVSLALAALLVAQTGGGLSDLLRHGASNSTEAAEAAGRHVLSAAEAAEAYGRLPLSFEENRGQADKDVKFISRGANSDLFLTANEAVLALRRGRSGRGESGVRSATRGSDASRQETTVLRMRLEGANASPRVAGLERQKGLINYLVGDDPSRWRVGVSTFAKISYTEVYPGVDLVYYGNQRELEFDFVVAPGSDPRPIRLAFGGADRIHVSSEGELKVLAAGGGELVLRKPVIYQTDDTGRRVEVPGGYQLRGRDQVAFNVGKYDAARPLVIDPVVVYSTFLGSIGGESGHGIAVDGTGNAYVTGQTSSPNFPSTKSIRTGNYASSGDVFVTKINATGTELVYSTIVGGGSGDRGLAIALDPSGNAYVTGQTSSADFPLVNPIRGGGNFFRSGDAGANWSSISGNGLPPGEIASLVVHPQSPATVYAGVAYAGLYRSPDGGTNWTKLNVTSGAHRVGPVVIARSAPSIIYAIVNTDASSSRLRLFKSADGGDTWAPVAALSDSTIYSVAIDPTNPDVLYASTYFDLLKSTNGGATWSQSDTGLNYGAPHSLTIDPTNPSVIYAAAGGGGVFKTTNAGANWAQTNSGLTNTNVLDLALDPTNTSILYAGTADGVFKTTNAGASWQKVSSGLTAKAAHALAIDPSTPATLYAGTSASGVFKTTDGGANWTVVRTGLSSRSVRILELNPSAPSNIFYAISDTSDYSNSDSEAFAFRLDDAGSALTYSTFLGGNANDTGNGIAVDGAGNAYVVGETRSVNFHTLGARQPAAGGSDDAFLVKLTPTGALNFATYHGGAGQDYATAVVVDSTGRAHMTGYTASSNFPVTPGAFRTTVSPSSPFFSSSDAFITRFNATGNSLDYSTYLGGSGDDHGSAIALDAAGAAYVAGRTDSANFPTASPVQAAHSGGVSTDAFVSKLNAAGSALEYSTYLGGEEFDEARGIAVDSAGSAHVVGSTNSRTFPVTRDTLRNRSAFYMTADGGAHWENDSFGFRTSTSNPNNLLADPRRPGYVYVGTFDGILRSTDGGRNWVRGATGLPTNLPISVECVDSSADANVYALAASSYSSSGAEGVYRSADGGATWVKLVTSGMPSMAPGVLACDPSTPNTLYAGGNITGLYKSTDGGANWIRVGASSLFNSVSIVVDPKTPSTLYVSSNTSPSGGVYKSTDGGMTWARMNSGVPTTHTGLLAIDPQNPSTLYLSTGGLYKSEDGAASWRLVHQYGSDISIDPRTPSTVYTSTGFGVFKTTDAGTTWAAVNNGLAYSPNGLVEVDPHSPAGAYFVARPSIIDDKVADAFVTKLSPTGSAFEYSTYLGGSNGIGPHDNNFADAAYAVALDSAGNAYVTGTSSTSDFPTSEGSYQPFNRGHDAFITKLAVSYAIGGRVTDSGGAGVGGVRITLTGGETRTAVTGVDGSYYFTRLRVGASYTVHAAKENTLFAPSAHTFANLSANQTADFTASVSTQPFRLIHGRLTDTGGAALSRATVTLTGSRVETTQTDSAGNYSFSVPQGGNYTVTPSLVGFTFTPPSRSIADPVADVVADFAGARGRFVVTNTNNTGAGSLRQAILDANTAPGADFIDFNIPGAGVRTLNLGLNLPEIADPVTIDATTQPGYAGSPLVEINGGGLEYGFVVKAGASTLRGMVINRFNASAVRLEGGGGNTIQGCYIGTDKTGMLHPAPAGSSTGNNGPGVSIFNSSGNLVGGSTAAARNVISSNNYGVVVNGAASVNNQIAGNYIGTDKTGAKSLSNGIAGVELASSDNTLGPGNVISGNGNGNVRVYGANNVVRGNYIGTDAAGAKAIEGYQGGIGVTVNGMNNTVGGTTAAARNVISGTGVGISFSSDTKVQGNYIGTDATGSFAVPNSTGIEVNAASNSPVVIGGTEPGARNVISGNTGYGIYLRLSNGGSGAVQGNYIGTDASGSYAVGNRIGVAVGTSGAIIGGTTAAARNVISGNNYGVDIGSSTSGTIQDTVIVGNYIGSNARGDGPVPNVLAGVNVGGSTQGARIGGTEAGAGNLIAFNTGDGVALSSGLTSDSRVAVRGNSIFSNGDLGLDLGSNGPDVNDSLDADGGGNFGQNYPVLNAVSASGDSTTVAGTLDSTPNKTFNVDLYSNAACGQTGYGEGARLFHTLQLTTGDDGRAAIAATVNAPLPSGRVLTATATDEAGNTSEFSPCNAGGARGNARFGSAAYGALEDAGSVHIPVRRVGGSRGILTVNYSTADLTATAGQDYTAVSGVLTFADGETEKTISIPVATDALDEAEEFVRLSLNSPGDPEGVGSPSVAMLSIHDNDTPLKISFELQQVREGDEGSTERAFTFTLSAATSRAVAADYSTFADTALAGSDFEAVSGRLVFAPGTTEQSVNVRIIGDRLDEADERFFIGLQNLSNAEFGIVSHVRILDDDAAPSVSVSDTSVAEGNAGTTNAVFNLTLSAASGRTTRVRFETAPGTATAGQDFTAASGNVTFLPGETTKMVNIAVVGDTSVEPDETFIVSLSSPNNVVIADGQGQGTIIDDDGTQQGALLQFGAANLQLNESERSVVLSVVRIGDASSAATVDYRTDDADTFTVSCADAAGAKGSAYARCDFATAVGKLSFGAGETQKMISIPLINDGHVEGNESFQVILSNPTGAALGSPGATTVTIADNDAAGAPNPVAGQPFDFFVRQQYLDFLSREPDESGFNAWLGVLNNCPNAFTGPEVQSGCDRIFVSGEGFFRSPEFQLKGFYVFRFYKVAFDRLPEYLEVVSDMSFVAGQTAEEVYARKAQLATLFTERAEFKTAYDGMTNAQYVAALMNRYNLTQITTPDPANPDGNAKVTLGSAELTSRLDANTLTRAQVLRAIADSDAVGAQEFNNAFVAMQYYGYLRRKPDQAGFDAWLRVLQSGDVRTMVNGFLNSTEYKLRFGQP